ncbi:MAG: NHL repeat-containing protein [Candidatus Eisenbacteria bacterium]|nr:NHL repeat-containing protein [Candidatus Eisenbacteria bacterium]
MLGVLCALAALAAAGARADSLRARVVATPLAIPAALAGLSAVEPAGIALDAFGRLFISDARQHRVMRFDSAGTWLGAEGTLGSEPGEFRRPGALALSGTLDLVVLDRENRRVVRYDHWGHLRSVRIDLADPALEERIGRVDPADIATDRGGALALVDRDADRVLIFDFSGNFLRALGGFGDLPGLYRGLSGVAFTPRGDLVTTERAGRRLQQIDPGGRSLASWSLAVQAGRGALPVAVDERQRIAVADESGGRLWLFDPSGRVLATCSGLRAPRALSFSPDGSLWVAGGDGASVLRIRFESAIRDSAHAE